MDSLVACKVSLVAESSLAAVTLVWLVAVHLEHVLFQRFVFGKLGVAFITEECTIFCSGEIIVKKCRPLVLNNTYIIVDLSLTFTIHLKLTTTGVGVF